MLFHVWLLGDRVHRLSAQAGERFLENQWLLRLCLCTQLGLWPELSWWFVLKTGGHWSQLPGNSAILALQDKKGLKWLGKKSGDHMNTYEEASRKYHVDCPEIQKPSGVSPWQTQCNSAAFSLHCDPVPGPGSGLGGESSNISPLASYHQAPFPGTFSSSWSALWPPPRVLGLVGHKRLHVPELVPAATRSCLLSWTFSK